MSLHLGSQLASVFSHKRSQGAERWGHVYQMYSVDGSGHEELEYVTALPRDGDVIFNSSAIKQKTSQSVAWELHADRTITSFTSLSAVKTGAEVWMSSAAAQRLRIFLPEWLSALTSLLQIASPEESGRGGGIRVIQAEHRCSLLYAVFKMQVEPTHRYPLVFCV